MTYIESVLGDFIKSIFTRGIKTLKSERFFPYTSVLLLIVIFSTFTTFVNDFNQGVISQDLINTVLYLELGTGLSFLITGLFLGRASLKVQFPTLLLIAGAFITFFYMQIIPNTQEFLLILGGILYISWMVIMTFSTFSLFRDLYGSNIFGTILFLGKKEDDGKALFSSLGILVVILNFSLGYVLYTKAADNEPLYFVSLVIMATAVIAMLPLFGFQKKNDVFFSILTSFYMFSIIRVFLVVFRFLTATSGETSFWDSVFSLFMALYTVQGAAAKGVHIAMKTETEIEQQLMEESGDLGFSRSISRFLSDRGIVMVILGVLLGFHSMQVQTKLGQENIFSEFEILSGSDIVILGYEFSLLITLFIYLISLLLFMFIPAYRRYANPEITRIPWAPPYDDLKAMLAGIKSGEVSWKGDAAKLVIGLAGDKLKSKLGMGTSDTGSRISSTMNRWLGRKE